MSPRDVYKPSGEPEEQKNIATLNNMYGQELTSERLEKSRDRAVDVQKVQEIMSHVDFDALQKTFESLGSKCGITPDRLNFLSQEQIFLKPNKHVSGLDIQGEYNNVTNAISIFPSILLRIAEVYDGVTVARQTLHGTVYERRYGKAKDSSTYFWTLQTLVHEQVHAVSSNRLTSYYPNTLIHLLQRLLGVQKNPEGYDEIRSGYTVKKPRDKYAQKWDVFFSAFDEGVTEKIASEIVRDYLANNDGPFSNEERKKFLEQNVNQFYGEHLKLVEKIVQSIAKKSGLNTQTVWHAIIRSKIEGVNLDDTEIGEFIDEHTFDGFIAELKELSHTDYVKMQEIQDNLQNN